MTLSAKPNVVFILADNLGWGDLSSYGGTVQTPRIVPLPRTGCVSTTTPSKLNALRRGQPS
jgi:arylsulfatase A-like enzyme